MPNWTACFGGLMEQTSNTQADSLLLILSPLLPITVTSGLQEVTEQERLRRGDAICLVHFMSVNMSVEMVSA